MILILSQSTSDPTTERVIDWIDALGGQWIRLNGEALESESPFTIRLGHDGLSLCLQNQGHEIDTANISVVWLRRWHQLQSMSFPPLSQNGPLFCAVSTHLIREFGIVTSTLFSCLGKARWLSDATTMRPNKIRTLQAALEVGLDVPSTVVTNNTATALHFKQRHGRVIVKPLSDGAAFPCASRTALMYTSELADDLLASSADNFFPSLIQQLVEKDYEIRSFYLAGKFYSMAIFSQNDPRTEIDFRHYNRKKPNRAVPYQLPEDISSKLRRLMDRMHLETASIDLIRSTTGTYFFLEVNPAGQFDWLARHCNYSLEKLLAEHLISLEA